MSARYFFGASAAVIAVLVAIAFFQGAGDSPPEMDPHRLPAPPDAGGGGEATETAVFALG